MWVSVDRRRYRNQDHSQIEWFQFGNIILMICSDFAEQIQTRSHNYIDKNEGDLNVKLQKKDVGGQMKIYEARTSIEVSRCKIGSFILFRQKRRIMVSLTS